MSGTRLVYLYDFNKLKSPAVVASAAKSNDNDVVILDQTIFYPQGGGQPYDQGVIESESSRFLVDEVRLIDDIVHHFGKFETAHAHFKPNENVNCEVDTDLRHLHSRVHSAGHVIDLAIQELKLGWVPGKGYHFPQGPYVEYQGSLNGIDKDKLKADIETLCNRFIDENRITKIKFMIKEELPSVCYFIPDYLNTDKPIRVVMFGDFGVPCGGTHVNSLSEIKKMNVRKLKIERGNVRISYDVER